MIDAQPKWNRRKDARPGEIIDAAMDVFVERGFAAAKLDDIARRAGIAKGTLYRYFETKEDIFRAVARHAIATNLQAIEAAGVSVNGSLTDLVALLLRRVADNTGDSRIPAIARMVIGESQTFPDLARIWHDDVAARVLDLVAGIVVRAQERGEVQPGDPRLFAFSIVGPMISALLYHQLFGSFSAQAPDLNALAAQHARTVLHGLLTPTGKFEANTGGAP
jgi:AcrR family transcriptional regulator